MSRAYTVTTRHRYATCRLRQRLRDRNRSRNQGWMLSDTQGPVRMSPGLGEFELRRTVMRWPPWTPRAAILPLLSGKSSSCSVSAEQVKPLEYQPDCNPVLDQATACSTTFGECENFNSPLEATSTSMKSPALYAPRKTCSANGFSRLF